MWMFYILYINMCGSLRWISDLVKGITDTGTTTTVCEEVVLEDVVVDNDNGTITSDPNREDVEAITSTSDPELFEDVDTDFGIVESHPCKSKEVLILMIIPLLMILTLLMIIAVYIDAFII